MSAVGFHFNRSVSTTLDLNGPFLSFTQQPESISTAEESVTLTGIATVSFDSTEVVNDGTIEYQWYEIGVGPLQEGNGASGTATTSLTLENLRSPDDNGRQFYLESSYTPTSSTGKAINAPHYSETVVVSVLPLIGIVAQPSNATTIPNRSVTFTVDARLSDSTFDEGLSYQWTLNGELAVEGTQEVLVPVGRFDETFSSDTTISIPSDAFNVEIDVSGGSGGDGGKDNRGVAGVGGPGRYGKFEYPSGARTLDLRVGRNGNDGGRGSKNVYGSEGASSVAKGGRGGDAGNKGYSGGGGGGGGASGVFDRSVGYYTIVAGGGGGGGGSSFKIDGGDGVSSDSFESSSGSFSISNGSAGKRIGNNRDGGGGGGGGGGATGGAGGENGEDQRTISGGGTAGGSKYSVSIGSTLIDERDSDGSGFIKVKYDVPETSESTGNFKILSSTTCSGTQTETLTTSTVNVGIQTVACILSHPTAVNSPLTSDTALFTSLFDTSSYPLKIEEISGSAEATIVNVDLYNGEFVLRTFEGNNSDPDELISFYSLYAPDKDLNVEVDLYGGKGASSGNFIGGEGGFSRIRFTIEKNVEYVISGLNSLIDAPFLYRKGSLIACVGQGGSAGSSGNGGFGGGIGVSGDRGNGRRGGEGGQSVSNGTLSNVGIFGSFFTTAVPIAPDTIAPNPDGGRTLPCPYGVYWRNQGVSACSDVGTTKFRLSDGTVVTNTEDIQRGYKAGYSIIETAGLGNVNGGNGGNGATGGRGGVGGDGGGGASGYTNGSVTVVSSILGGSNDVARVVIRIVD